MPAISTQTSNGIAAIPVSNPRKDTTVAEPAYRVIRRNGGVTPFDPTKITVR